MPSQLASYAFHCLKVWVGLVFVVHSKLFKWSPTHVVDMQYLNYRPFCQVFSSNDKLHRILVPALKRDDQTFLTGEELKKMTRERSGLVGCNRSAGPRQIQALTLGAQFAASGARFAVF